MDSYGIAKSGSAIAQLIARTDGRTYGRPTRPIGKSRVPNRAGKIREEKAS